MDFSWKQKEYRHNCFQSVHCISFESTTTKEALLNCVSWTIYKHGDWRNLRRVGELHHRYKLSFIQSFSYFHAVPWLTMVNSLNCATSSRIQPTIPLARIRTASIAAEQIVLHCCFTFRCLYSILHRLSLRFRRWTEQAISTIVLLREAILVFCNPDLNSFDMSTRKIHQNYPFTSQSSAREPGKTTSNTAANRI